MLDLGNGFLRLANTDIGTFVTQLLLLTSVGWGASELLKISKILPTIVSQFSILTEVGKAASAAGGIKSISDIFAAIELSAGAALPTILVLSAAIIGVVAAIKNLEENYPTLEEATEELNSLNSQLETNNERLKEINSLSWNEKTPEILAEKEALEEQNKELEKSIELYTERQQRAAQEIVDRSGYAKTGETKFQITSLGDWADRLDSSLAWSQFDSLEEAVEMLQTRIPEAASMSIEQLEAMGVVIEEVDEKVRVSGEDYEKYLIEEAQNYIDILNKQHSLNENQIQDYNEIINAINERANAEKILGNDSSDLINIAEELSSTFERYSNEIVVSKEFVDKLTAAYPSLSGAINSSNGVLSINGTKLNELAQQSNITTTEIYDLIAAEISANSQKLDFSQQLAALQQLATQAGYAANAIANVMAMSGDNAQQKIRARATVLYRLRGVESFDKAMQMAQEEYLNNIWSDIKSTQSNTTPTSLISTTSSSGSSGSSSSSAAKSTVDTWKQAFEDWYAWANHQLAMNQITEEEYIKELDKQNEKYFANKEKYQEDYWKYSEEIYEWEKEHQKEFLEDQKEFLEQQKSEMQSVISYVTEYSQRQIDALNEEKEALESSKEAINSKYDSLIENLEKTNEELDKEIERERLLEALARAKSQVQLVYKDGQFQYIGDIDAVSEAQTALDEFDKEQLLENQKEFYEEQRENELQSIEDQEAALDEQINLWEKYKEEWANLESNYEYQQNALIAAQKYGIELENSNWTTRLANLQSFVSQYTALMGQITSLQGQITALDETGLAGGLGTATGGLGSIGFAPGNNILGTDWSSVAYNATTLDELQDALEKRQIKAEALGIVLGSDGYKSNKEIWNEVVNKINSGSYYGGSGSSGGNYNSSGSSSSSNYGGYGSREDFNNAIKDAVNESSSSGDKIYIGDSGLYIDPNKVSKNAKGTLSATNGISLVGENGPELRLLNDGDGILPSNITKNLWNWGSLNPSTLLGNIGSNFSVVMQNVDMSFPNIKNGNDAESFMKNIVNIAYQTAYKRA